MDHGRAEILLGSIVRGRDVQAVEEDEHVGAMLAIAILESARVARLGLWQEGPEYEAIDGILDAAPASGERLRGDRRTNVVKVDGTPEQVPHLDGPHPTRVAVGLAR